MSITAEWRMFFKKLMNFRESIQVHLSTLKRFWMHLLLNFAMAMTQPNQFESSVVWEKKTEGSKKCLSRAVSNFLVLLICVNKVVFPFIWGPKCLCKPNTKLNTRGVFRNLSNIYDGAFVRKWSKTFGH